MPPPKIAVIGSINEDLIIHGGEQRHSYGGILYNLVALALLLPETEIAPLTFLGKNIWPKVGWLTRELTWLDWGHAPKQKRKTNRVRLFYLSNGEKQEILKHPNPPFAWKNLKPVLDADALLINFISGWELSPRLFQKLRREFAGTIHVDMHSLLLGIRKSGGRFRRAPKHWDVFLDADFVQMNQREWEQVAERPFSRKNLIRFCGKWKYRKWRAILVTLAEKGAVMAWRDGEIQVFSHPAPAVKNPEQTGAGDFFAAGFLGSFIQGEKPKKALAAAVHTASWKCRYEGIERVLAHRFELKRFLTTPARRSKLRA